MKKIFLTAIISVVTLITYGQTISPSQNDEYCPNTEYTFTASITKPYSSIIGVGGCAVTQQPSSPVGSTFTFKGTFNDVNQKQTFKIYHTDGTQTDFDFKKIKSLFYGACSAIQPNISSITVNLCTVQNFSISFNNLQWQTAFENPALCFGSITTYEYLIPSGWSLNGTTSTGNWIAAGNTVTVTSDQTTGNGQNIQVRAINTGCGSGLSKGQILTIPISRPAPPLSISGATQGCYPNSYTYTLNGVPSGASISWNNTNSYYSLSASGNTATVTPTSAANGSTTINATVTLSCGPSFSAFTTVSLGAPYATFSITSYPDSEPNCYEANGIYSYQAQQLTGYPNTFTSTQWGWRNLTTSSSYTDPTTYGLQYTFFPYEAGQYELWVKPVNSCGVGTVESVKNITVVEVCSGGFRTTQSTLNVYPNPVKNKVKVQIPKECRKNGLIQVSNQYGVIVLTRKVPNDIESIDIDLSMFKEGIYQLVLKADKIIKQTKIIK